MSDRFCIEASNGDLYIVDSLDEAKDALYEELAGMGRKAALYRLVPIPFRQRIEIEIEDSPAPAPAEPHSHLAVSGAQAQDAGDVVSQEGAELREQVASVEAPTIEGPQAASPYGTHAQQPAEDRQVAPDGQRVPGEGATASPAAANGEDVPPHRWGAVAAEDPIFHAWRIMNWHTDKGFLSAEALCGEVTNTEFAWLAEGVRPAAREACTDCADTTGWDAPTKLTRPDEDDVDEPSILTPDNATRVFSVPSVSGRCEEMNRSAGVPCGAVATAGNVGGKWLCKRHSRRTNGAGEVAGG